MLWSLARPHPNWDMLAYAAAAERFESADPHQWHQVAFESARHLLHPAEFQRLAGTEPGSFRRLVHEDPDLFAAQLDFYTGRVVYIGATRALSMLGFNPLRAQQLVSGMAAVLGLVFLALLLQRLQPTLPLILLPLTAAIFGLLQISRLGTPDALTFAAVCASALLLVRRDRALLLLLPVLVGVRTDLILWTFPLHVFLLAGHLFRRRAVVASLLGTLLMLLVLQHGHPGWWSLLHVTLIEPLPVDPLHPPSPDLGAYVLLVKRGLVALSADKAALLFLLVCLATTLWAPGRLRDRPHADVLLLLIGVSLGYFVIHFLLFPVTWERFFVGPYCIASVAGLHLLIPRRPAPTPAAR
jgi:hypothetical protein